MIKRKCGKVYFYDRRIRHVPGVLKACEVTNANTVNYITKKQ